MLLPPLAVPTTLTYAILTTVGTIIRLLPFLVPKVMPVVGDFAFPATPSTGPDAGTRTHPVVPPYLVMAQQPAPAHPNLPDYSFMPQQRIAPQRLTRAATNGRCDTRYDLTSYPTCRAIGRVRMSGAHRYVRQEHGEGLLVS